jgi:hypothetical protein
MVHAGFAEGDSASVNRSFTATTVLLVEGMTLIRLD